VVPSLSVRVSTATARRRSGRPRRSVAAASSSRQRAPSSTASSDARSSAPKGPRSTETDRCSPATADSPAADPAASRSSSCGISSSIAWRRRAVARAATTRRIRSPSNRTSGTVTSFGAGISPPMITQALIQTDRASTRSAQPREVPLRGKASATPAAPHPAAAAARDPATSGSITEPPEDGGSTGTPASRARGRRRAPSSRPGYRSPRASRAAR
jgi:hypothetical protein